ncbi:hypothetical protein L2U69_07730 [Zavarzinia compransoris]|uniref:hypothetical protein n=1 Tax=Zavarzinia marina TaxID=2911065 RepID=UPI001F335ED9|nr:hypothetical protein [Zavarzinia marina]MCF4165527.1 hypothetical protein [Zavarzinia marina]
MISRRAFLVAVPLVPSLAGLGACAATDPAPSFPPFHVGGAPLRLNVAEIEVVDRSSFFGEGHVEGEFDVPPLTALTNWLGDRLQAAGSSGRLTVTITDASAIEERLATTGGVQGVFTDEPGARVTTRLDVRFDARREITDGTTTAQTTVSVSQTDTVPKDAGFTERRQVLYGLSRRLIEDFDAKAIPALRRYMADFL